MTQSQRNGYAANLLLSSSLGHASKAAAASISKDNNKLFKHPKCAQPALEVKESGERYVHT